MFSRRAKEDRAQMESLKLTVERLRRESEEYKAEFRNLRLILKGGARPDNFIGGPRLPGLVARVGGIEAVLRDYFRVDDFTTVVTKVDLENDIREANRRLKNVKKKIATGRKDR